MAFGSLVAGPPGNVRRQLRRGGVSKNRQGWGALPRGARAPAENTGRLEIQSVSHSYKGRLSRDTLVPHHTSDGFDLAPGGAMAREVQKEFAVGTKYADARLRRWNQWAEFCALGDGQGNEYELYSVNNSKWLLFAG